MSGKIMKIELENEAATRRLGDDLALALKPGDMVALSGDLGAGKSVLARALIRAACADADLEVPSPTFTLVQTYQRRVPEMTLSHFDLYRIENVLELDELGLDEALENGIALVEWPERAVGQLPAERLAISIEHIDETRRRAYISGSETILTQVRRSLDIRKFLTSHWDPAAQRRYHIGDASTRTYEMVRAKGKRRILMNAPKMTDGPVIQDGKPYSQIAHLAEDVRPFAAIAGVLRTKGFRAPDIYAADFDSGFLLTEYLGHLGVLDDTGAPIAQRYLAAVETLAAMHQVQWPTKVTLEDGTIHTIPAYDRQAMMIEVDLLVKWYGPYRRSASFDPGETKAFYDVWLDLVSRLGAAEKSLVLRDFHSPNLLWQPESEGVSRIGLIDFQDAMIGPSAYDVASLAQDARVDISATLENQLLATYLAARSKADASFDQERFLEAYAIMACQRAMKLLGLFVRLDQRDNKPSYLAHLPRKRAYLRRIPDHPALSNLRDWLARNLGEDY